MDALATEVPRRPRSLITLLKQLIRIGIGLSSERDIAVLLERIVAEARRFTNAESGTLFLRENGALRFAVVQNEPPADGVRGPGSEVRLDCDLPSLAAQAAATGEAITLSDPRSMLVVPLREPTGDVIGVLQLLNARDTTGAVVPFDREFEGLVRSLAAQAAVAIRNAMLEDLSFKDPLTGAYNRRYFALRIAEEQRRYARFGEPVSLVLVDIDHFKVVNDRHGHGMGDSVLREVTRVLTENSRDFSIVTRYGGDEFAVLLVNTPKAGALRYAERILNVFQHHRFVHGHVTVSMGVATLPDDVRTADELVPAADHALYAAKQSGRNTLHSV